MNFVRSFLFFIQLMAIGLLLSSGLALAADPLTAFKEGTQQFNDQAWSKAQASFLSIVDGEKQISPDVCYALGNTAFRLSKLGEAALWYRRTLVLDPGHKAAQQNLRLIEKRLRGFLSFTPTKAQVVSSYLPAEIWKLGLTLCFWGLIFSVVALSLLKLSSRQRTWLWVISTVSCLLLVPSVFGILGLPRSGDVIERHIVIGEDVAALTAPTESAGQVISLPAGSEVVIKERNDEWTLVEIPGGEDGPRLGWVRQVVIAPLWPEPGHFGIKQQNAAKQPPPPPPAASSV